MKKRKILRLALLLCFGAALLFTSLGVHDYLKSHSDGTPAHSDSREKYQEKFDTYLESLFSQEVTASTINLHYTLKNPENYGIDDYTVTYGDISRDSYQASFLALENVKKVLESYDPKKLDTPRRLTYDILYAETELDLSAADLYLYQEMLRPSTGVQAELPVLMAEYAFYDEGDVQDYLALLGKTQDYFRQILLFQMEKANHGLFMSQFVAEDIISQCRNFIADKENNYLIETFADKIDAMEGLTEEQKQSYKEQNSQAVADSVIPAYEMMAHGLEKLKLSGKNQQGLCYLPEGKAYYEYLVKSYTGSDRTVEQMQEAATQKRAQDMSQAAKLLSENPDLLTQTASYAFAQQDPTAILTELLGKMKQDFPAPPDTNFTVKYVHPSLEEFMAPAFYLAVPIDDITQNSIYINSSNNYQKLKLYTTLAHEGYPGHLYQNVMERSQGFPTIRSLLGTSGYSEGWATYVEMIAYQYADMDHKLAQLFQLDQSALLSLYATADMGIHYDGWSLARMKEFFGEYQITNEEALTDVYQLIVEEPAHYLKYYIGYLEFLDLKEYAKKLYGEAYSDYRFHEALMRMGPAQFPVLREYLEAFYGGKTP